MEGDNVRKFLRENQTLIRSKVTNIFSIITYLYSKGFISFEEQEQIRIVTNTQAEKWDKISEILIKKSSRLSMDIIRKMFKISENSHIISELEIDHEIVTHKRKEEKKFSFINLVKNIFHLSNITYIANAYHTDIWVSFSEEKVSMNKIQASLKNMTQGPGVSISEVLNNVSYISWVKLSTFGTPFKKNRIHTTEYVTVVSVGEGNYMEILVYNSEIGQNFSFIVTQKGEFLQQEYGGDLWKDYAGTNHEKKSFSENKE